MPKESGWVTINGVHVFIDNSGKISKGPAKFIAAIPLLTEKQNSEPSMVTRSLELRLSLPLIPVPIPTKVNLREPPQSERMELVIAQALLPEVLLPVLQSSDLLLKR